MLRLSGAARALALLAAIAAAPSVSAQISLTTPNAPYSQDFDTLAASGTTNTSVPAGWTFSESGGNANGQYRAVSGSNNTGDTLSLGNGSEADRAFGGLRSGQLVPTIGASFQNNTGTAITALAIAYVGEQWRQGGTDRFDRLDFQYSLDATSLTSGTWTHVDELDFEAPHGGGTTGALDGNDPANQSDIAHIIEGLAIPNGDTFWIRWTDFDAAGADDALGIDDFSLTPNPVGGVQALSIANASVAEGDSGTTPLNFTVTLSGPAPAGGVAFTVTTTDGTAESPSDFAALTDEPFFVPEGETTATVTVQINGDDTVEPNETFTATIATSASGVVLGNATATGTILNDDADIVAIYAIQGSGLRSPFAPASGNGVGALVDTSGNIVTAISSNGFFMQTPDADDDNDPATSNGIFVFTGGAPSVQVGDVVDVAGSVQEYFDWTQLTGATVTVTSSGATLPTAVVLDETRPSADPLALSCPDTASNFECYENMRVHVPAGAVVQGNQRFGTDLFGEAFATASGERARREKGLLPNATPPVAGLPVWDGNPEVFELDADGAGAVAIGTAIFGGDLFEATGVIAYQFGNYALRPTQLTIVPAELPRAVPAQAGDAELRVGSMNTLNLCQGSCGSQLGRIAEYIGDVLLLPDVVGLQELHGTTAASTLATRLNTDYGTDYVAYFGSTPHSDGIRNGFLVKASRVAVTRVRNLNAAATIDVCEGTPPCIMHDRPPYLLEGNFTGGDGEAFAVMNNHTRSLIGIGDAGATGTRVRAKRFAQGKDIAELVQRFQTGQELEPDAPIGNPDTVDVPLVLVGDYNAFEVTDGYVDVAGLIAGSYDDSENEYQLGQPNIVDPPLVNLVLDVPVEDRYSYAFTENLGNVLAESPRNVGSVQVLDHGMVNEAALKWCGGLHYGRGNADAPAELRNTGTGAIGSSDHDGLVVRLFTDRLFAHDFEDGARCRR